MKDTIMLIYDKIPLQITLNEQTTRLCLLWCLILQQNALKTWFGHFSVENPDTGQKYFFATLPPNKGPASTLHMYLQISNGEVTCHKCAMCLVQVYWQRAKGAAPTCQMLVWNIFLTKMNFSVWKCWCNLIKLKILI